MQTDTLSITIAVVSAITAVMSAVFAWRTVKIAERSNAAAHVAELHNIYRSENNFRATQVAWDFYREYGCRKKKDGNPITDGTPITEKRAREFLGKVDRKSKKWKGVHDAWVYWNYLNLLLNKGFIDESLAMSGAFGSMPVLGFLYPMEKAFMEEQGMTYTYRESLQSLYDRWQKHKVKK